MQLGDMLVARGLVTPADIEAALARQVTDGGRLGENLVAMGLVTADQIAACVNTRPGDPRRRRGRPASPSATCSI